MHIEWTAHLRTPEEREKFKQQILSHAAVLQRLDKIIEEKIRSAEREMYSEEAYNIGDWAYKQADNLGKIRALRHLRTFTNMKELG